VLSPCVTFNDHEDSTKSYAHAREFNHPVIDADFVMPAEEIKAAYDEGDVLTGRAARRQPVVLTQGATRISKSAAGRDDRVHPSAPRDGEIVTGLLYVNEGEPDLHGVNGTTTRRR
jgi:2-oxoglutarate ferredoxin oxidoreductase subunit beta